MVALPVSHGVIVREFGAPLPCQTAENSVWENSRGSCVPKQVALNCSYLFCPEYSAGVLEGLPCFHHNSLAGVAWKGFLFTHCLDLF